jgi:hypothetical protein
MSSGDYQKGKDTMHPVDPFLRENQRKSRAVLDLYEAGRHDPTVDAFIRAWTQGAFPSFEEMLCGLAVQLAKEKATYLKRLQKAIQNAPPPDVLVDDIERFRKGWQDSPGDLSRQVRLSQPPPDESLTGTFFETLAAHQEAKTWQAKVP